MPNYDLFDAVRQRSGDAPPPPPEPPFDPRLPGPEEPYSSNLPALRHRRRFPWRWVFRGLALLALLFIAAVVWLALTAPLSKSLQPPTPPSITLLSAEGTPIARRGATIGAPVDVAKLPKHVGEAFVAIEDRRFYHHWGVDPRGILRALVHNSVSSGSSQGGSTITQQLAKNAFLNSNRTVSRKLQEVMIAFWLEAWLSKDEILSRYLSNVYFGDNVYGLSAAARHYFSKRPDQLSVAQAAMLAGLVKAPSRLAPTGNLKGAQARQKLVVAAMRDEGFITAAQAADAGPARLHPDEEEELPNGTYFADWVLPQARDQAGEIASELTVKTTLETRMQKAAEHAVRSAGLPGKAQVALVAMRPDGRVVAMVGGRSYAASPFNRATQAKRQPGSTFKLFVYLAALRSGMTPDSTVLDEPITIGNWSPSNSDRQYRGEITLRDAFARSSNVAAARLIQQVGPRQVIRAARDLGISTPIENEASIALGTSTTSLLELTAAYAAIAAGSTPVRPHGLLDQHKDSWLDAVRNQTHAIPQAQLDGMRDLLATTVQRGTGTGAALSIPAFGKTGTTQDARDVLFVGFAGDLVVGVWVGNDDNTPSRGLKSSLPARIWRGFMMEALGVTPPVVQQPAVDEEGDNVADMLDGISNRIDVDVDSDGVDLQGDLVGRPFNLRLGRDGIRLNGSQGGDPDEAPPPRRRGRDDAAPTEGEDEGY